jgi:hypothetical protein
MKLHTLSNIMIGLFIAMLIIDPYRLSVSKFEFPESRETRLQNQRSWYLTHPDSKKWGDILFYSWISIFIYILIKTFT